MSDLTMSRGRFPLDPHSSKWVRVVALVLGSLLLAGCFGRNAPPTNAAPDADGVSPVLEKGMGIVTDAADIAPFFLLSLPD
ncbi:MAG: hypothetical protein WDZ49_01970, partial [Litorilinea sp.]